MKIPRRTVALFIGLASGLALAKMGFAQQHIMQNMTEAQWGDAPPFSRLAPRSTCSPETRWETPCTHSG